jgi:ribosome-binding protein aMBF1 (putative translation factor)
MTKRLADHSITANELIERHKQDDPAFRDAWERTSFAREVAHAVIRYRSQHDLTIEQLAEQLGVDIDVVGTIEEGDMDPDVGTLRLLSEHLGLRFVLDIHPAGSSGAEVTYSVA